MPPITNSPTTGRKKTFIDVNNRLEGNALETISGMLEQANLDAA